MRRLAPLLLLLPATVLAHPVTSRSENNRYVKLTVMGGTLRASYSVLYGELPSFNERRAMDRDGDGRISPEEAHAWAAALATTLARDASLTVDGAPVRLTLPEQDMFLGDARVGPAPVAVDLRELVPLTPRARHEIRFEAGGELPRAGETEIRFDEAPGSRLTAACRGRGPCRGTAPEARFVWAGPRPSSMEDRSVSATFEILDQRERWPLIAGAAVALVAAAGVGMSLVRRRRRKS